MADLSITAASVVKVSGTPRVYTAGGTITAGQAVYIDTGDSNTVKAADNNVSALVATVAGIALNGAATGQPVSVLATASDVINLGATLTLGETYVLSDDPGGIAPIADILTTQYVSIIGVAVTTANLRLLLYNSGIAHA